jgi:hypothetical protein
MGRPPGSPSGAADFSALMLGMLLAALDQTIVATALPTITGPPQVAATPAALHRPWLLHRRDNPPDE